MGCAQSTEGQVLSNEMGKAGAGQTISMGVPSIPGWNRIPNAIMHIRVSFEIKGGWSELSASMDPLLNAIMAQNTAGQGYSLAAVFLPVVTQGQPMEMERKGWRTITAYCMCIFQKNANAPMAPLETLLLKSTMKQKTRQFSIDAIQIEGYEGLYGQLGQAGNQGFPLSAVIDEPNMKVKGFTTTETSVHLICQKNQGVQNPPFQYLIVNCQIKITNNLGSVSASIPDLMNFLSSYCTQGHKIASVYNPPTATATGFMSHETQCHIILSKTHENYYVTVRDVPFKVKSSLGGSLSVDHNQYLSVIEAYASQGWALAGLIDMPDATHSGFMSVSSTIKLIFQAPAPNGQPGGAL